MEKMMLENEKIKMEIQRLEAETEVLRVKKNVLLRLQEEYLVNSLKLLFSCLMTVKLNRLIYLIMNYNINVSMFETKRLLMYC